MTSLQNDEVARLLAQVYELQQRVLQGRLDPHAVRRGLQLIIEGRSVVSCQPASHFVSLAQQIVNIEKWNAERNWGFSPEQIARRCLEARTFDWPGDSLQAIVLVPSLATPGATLKELLAVSSVSTWPAHAVSTINDSNNVTLVEGIGFTPNTLEWRLVDLGAHRRSEGQKLRYAWKDQLVTVDTAAHAEVVAATAHFPLWVDAVRHKHVPQVVVPGYRIADLQYGGTNGATILLEGAAGGYVQFYATVGEDNTIWGGDAVATAGPVPLGSGV